MNAVDLSNFSGKITAEQAKLIRDSNRKVIIGTQDPDIATQQAVYCREACLEIDFYQMCYLGIPVSRELNKTIKVAQESEAYLGSGPRVWLDFEEDIKIDYPYGPTMDVIIGWIWRTLNLTILAGFRPGIYTRRNWWIEYTGDTNIFDHPLWDANYDGKPDLNVFTPYGSWTKATMKQYSRDFDLFGVKVDLNVY